VCSLTVLMPDIAWREEEMSWQEAVVVMEGVVRDYADMMTSAHRKFKTTKGGWKSFEGESTAWPDKIIKAWKRIQKG